MSKPPPQAQAGWYDDPSDSARTRWWDGKDWTEATLPKTTPADSNVPPSGQANPQGEDAPDEDETDEAIAEPEVAKNDAKNTATPGGQQGTDSSGADHADGEGNNSKEGGCLRLVAYAAVAVVVVVIAVIVLKSCGGDSGTVATVPRTTSTAAVSFKVKIDKPADRGVVRTKAVRVSGTVSPTVGVAVYFGETNTAVYAQVGSDGRWSAKGNIALGESTISAVAGSGASAISTSVTVIRKRSQADLAARKEARAKEKQQEAAAKASYEADYKASAKSIPYGKLEKNAAAYSGTRVVLRGEVFQIQESSGRGVMLLSVTSTGYGGWTDNVWVNFVDSTSFVKGDIVTIWGEVVGSKTYKTQAGGETYVPEIDAEFLSAG